MGMNFSMRTSKGRVYSQGKQPVCSREKARERENIGKGGRNKQKILPKLPEKKKRCNEEENEKGGKSSPA